MDTNTLLIYILIATNLLTIAWLIRTELRLNKFFGGKKAGSFESVLVSIQRGLSGIESTHDEIKRRLVGAEKRLARSIRNVKTIRFNPFTDSGSNQSFATAIIDDHGDGVILSSLYSRERVSVFAKPVLKGKAQYDLTEEEDTVLKEAFTNE
jgi:hypothetical protein